MPATTGKQASCKVDTFLVCAGRRRESVARDDAGRGELLPYVKASPIRATPHNGRAPGRRPRSAERVDFGLRVVADFGQPIFQAAR
jgi:hypothetical protein